MTQSDGEIIIYNPSMAEEAAEMFNAFNELWPGGFGGGVPYTAQRVHDWLDKTSAIADLIAVTPDGELCGYCGLYPHWRDEKAAYISILGVTPKAKGKKFGKRLLLKSLEMAEKKGITRVDLHTWSGNMEAVPLYKKVGLFWVPETTVYMQDFIPGIMLNSVAKEWFNKHPDWYSCFVRDLSQKPDKEVIDNMELYPYIFEKDEDKLTMEIDRFGWGFCGVERILDGKKLMVKTRVESHNIFVGLTNTYTLEILNDYDEKIEANLDIKGFKGLIWKEDFPETITVEKGKVVTISREFTLDKKAKLFRDNDRACEGIKAKVTLGKKKVELVTSGKIQSPIKLRNIVEGRFKTIPSEREVIVPIDILNSTDVEIDGFVKVTAKGIPGFEQEIPIKLEPNQVSGFEFSVTIPKNRKVDLFNVIATPFLKFNGSTIELPEYDIPLLVKTKDLIELVELKDTNRLYLITDKLAVRIILEGGQVRIYHQENNGLNNLSHASGPPFGLSLDRSVMWEYELKKGPGLALLTLKAKSQQVKGLLVKKYFQVRAGANEVEYWVEYTNLQSKDSIHASARTSFGFGGISLNPYSAKGRAFVPIGGKVIESQTFTNFLTDPLVPDSPDIWPETWTATEGIFDGDISAWVWKPNNIEKIKLRSGNLSRLDSETKAIEPGEIYRPIHVWYTFGYNNLQQVRNRYNQLVGNKELSYMENFVGPETTKDLDITLQDERIFFTGETYERTLKISFVSAYPLPGELSLKLPKGWKGTFLTEEGEKAKIPMPEPQPFTEKDIKIKFTIPDANESITENIQVKFNGEYELYFDNFVVVTENGSIDVKESELEGGKVHNISNGEITYKVASELGGNLIRLEDKKGRQFLLDNFPKIQPKFFLDHYLGGAQPQTFHARADDPFTESEATTTKAIDLGTWKGTQTIWTIEKDKEYLKGIKMDLKLLTIPNSNLIKIKLTLDNHTSRTIPIISSVLCDIGLQGTKEGCIEEVNSPTGLWLHNAVPKMFMANNSFKEPYARVYKGDQSLAFIVPDGYYGTSIIADLGVMLLTWMLGLGYAEPKTKATMEFIVLVNQPREKMKEIKEALAKN